MKHESLNSGIHRSESFPTEAMGRPRKKALRLPTLETIAEDKQTHWKRIAVQQWYGEKNRMIEITSSAAVWYHSGHPPLSIRWVIVRDAKQNFKTQALLCADLSVSADQIVQWFVRRWQVQATFHEVRAHLGVETQRQWADPAILRITPALLGLFSMITLLANPHARIETRLDKAISPARQVASPKCASQPHTKASFSLYTTSYTW